MARASSGNQFWLAQLQGGSYDPKRVEATQSLVTDMTSITPQVLQATAAKYLRPEKDWTMAVLPKAAGAATAGSGGGAK
jgi:zinc protease